MSTSTLTFGDVAENHAGMEKIGKMAKLGFSYDNLKKTKEKFEEKGFVCEMIELHLLTGMDEKDIEEEYKAYVLVIREGLKEFCDVEKLSEEQSLIELDKKALMRGRVVNKKARYNVCFDEESQEPDYENGKGRIVSYNDVPILKKVRERLEEFFGEKARELKCEGNYYYDIEKCYIGFHGDAERRKVIGCRLGSDFSLYHLWFYKSKPIGQINKTILKNGDIYCMSEKAVGTDWMKKNTATLRHSAGNMENFWDKKKWGPVENHYFD